MNGASAAAAVLIIGGGPVGMMLAMTLHAFGVRSVIVNAEPHTRLHPKGGTQNTRTLEHYRRLGIARRIRRLGFPAEQPTDVIYFTRLGGWELARIAMPSEAEKMRAVQAAPATDQVPEPILRCNQMYVERFLFDHMRTLPSVEVRFGWHCLALEDDGTCVSATIEDAASGRRETLRGAFLVGCDGGQSLVRRTLGIRYDGGDPVEQELLGGPQIAAHVRAPDLYRIVKSRAYQYWILNPELRGNFLALDGAGEFKFGTRVDRAAGEPDEARAIRAFWAAVGAQIEVKLLGLSHWTAGKFLVANAFGAGRIFLAGDAAHLFNPTGAFGMNTGVDDAVNLGWKLAAVVQGWGGANLLPSYEAERRPIAFRNTAASKHLTRSIGAVPVDPRIEESSEAGFAARRRTGGIVGAFDQEFASLGVQLGARYDASPIVLSDGASPPPDAPETYVATSLPGGRAPHFWLGDGRGEGDSLFDRLGRGFTLLRLGATPPDAAPLVAAARARGVPLAVLDLPDAAARELYERDLALIRPDQHVAWRGNQCPGAPDRLVARVIGDE